jgi:hypothetical protein
MITSMRIAAAVLLASGLAATPARPTPRPIDNPYFPLRPGTTYVYEGSRDGKRAVDVMTVTDDVKVIEGVPCVVVRDRTYLGGHLEERTEDWYAQDAAGAVHYYGEATAELDEHGHVVSTEGSWQAGVNGARAGVFMPAHPRVGQTGLQEFYKGHAEDHFQVLSLSASVSVPNGTYEHALLTKEWTPLEPGVIDHKYYAKGIGTVKEQTVKGGSELLVLDAVVHG